jgi:hypothetical protein
MLDHRASKGRRRAGWMVASVAALLVLVAGVASATTVTLKSKTVTLPNDDVTHPVGAKCPLGTKAAGGGGKLGDDVNDYWQGSYPNPSNRRVWLADGWRSSGQSSGAPFTSYALCVSGRLKYVSHKKTLANDDSTHTVSATCPTGTRVTGGGIQLGDNLNDYVQGTYPASATRWVVAGYRVSSLATSSTFTAWVVCLPAGQVTIKSKQFQLPVDGTAYTGTAKCGTAGTVTGGGIQLGDDVNDYLKGSYPAAKTGWTGAAIGGGSANSFTVYAVCVK